MPFAQLVIGPPGAGKSTYCDGMHQFFAATGRKCSVVNLDPANDSTNYPCALDVRDLVPLEDVMEQEELGPNGGVLYALEELEENWTWMEKELEALKDDYILFDCPGQVELFTHHNTLPRIFHRLEKLGYRLIVVHLLDSHTISRPTLYVSSLLLCLRSMLHLPFPLVNVLTKIDNLIKTSEPLPFDLEFYTEVQDLDYLIPHLEAEQNGTTVTEVFSDPSGDPTQEFPETNFSALNRALVSLIQDFGLIGFETLAVEDKTSMTNLVHAIDRASGYVFGTDQGNNESIWKVAMQEGWGGKLDVRDVQERWIDRREEFDELERKQWEEEARLEKEKQSRGPEVVRNQTEEPTSEGQGDGGDDGDDELESLQRDFLAKKGQPDGEDSGVNVVRK